MKFTRFLPVAAAVLLMLASCKDTSSENKLETMAAAIPVFGVTLLSDTTDSDGVRSVSVEPSGVCSTQIDISVKDSVILSVKYTNGCSGNTQGVAKLVAGRKVQEAIDLLEGIDCGGKGTSCPDQLAQALKLFR